MDRNQKKRTVADIPSLLESWNTEKNGGLQPEDILAHSAKKIAWICERGHEWEASADCRSKYDCPFCSGRRPIAGETDLATIRPGLAAEWDYEKNGDLRPENVKPHFTKMIHWKCAKGHEWVASPDRRFNCGCPYCAGKRPVVGETDLATLRPDLAAEWNYEKNGTLLPRDVTTGSSKKVFWKCRNGHEWLTAIKHRVHGTNCPYCSGSYTNKPVEGVNDLATLHPELVLEWNKEKNGALDIQALSENSNRRVWWKCERGHEWKTSPSMRVGKGTNCPYCCGSYPIPGETDLLTVFPALAEEWNYELNGGLTPNSIAPFSNKKVWWKCKKGHQWMSTVSNRANGNGCPFCSGRLPIIGETDLASLRPDLAKEWHPTKNGSKRPDCYKAGSGIKVWWRCEKGHEWEAKITNRTCLSRTCPYCNGRKAIKGETDFATLRPDLLQEWHPTKNEIEPDSITVHSEKRVWWKCAKGHEWNSPIWSRFNGAGCPYCSGRKPLLGETDAATLFPNLLKEWNTDRNGDLRLANLTRYSNRKVWWKCNKGHEWRATVGHRGAGENCPFCVGKGRH